MRRLGLAMNFWTKLILLAATAVLMMAGSTAPVFAEVGATEAVQSTIAKVMRVLDDDRLKGPDQVVERRHEIEEIIRERVDYEEMAKRTLGAQWSSLSRNERREFVDLFVQLLRDTFAGRISERSDEQVQFLGEQQENNFARVRTQLKGRKVDTHVDFLLIH